MVVSDDPAKKTLRIQGVSVDGVILTVGFLGSERRHAVHFEPTDPAKAVTAFLQLRRLVSPRIARRSKRHILFSLGVYQALQSWLSGPQSTMTYTQPGHGTRSGRVSVDPSWIPDLVYVRRVSRILRYLRTLRVVVENSDDTFLVACEDRQDTIGEKEICTCQGSRMWVLPEDR